MSIIFAWTLCGQWHAWEMRAGKALAAETLKSAPSIMRTHLLMKPLPACDNIPGSPKFPPSIFQIPV